jgi:predicted adenylyl cyclase CyaB
MHINFEFKARCKETESLEKILKEHLPEYIGQDQQTDTYFNVPYGRMKLREGNIENSLIHYVRNNTAEAKQSDVILYQHHHALALKEILIRALGIKVVINKLRKIYFINNVKFHFDMVENLGTFVEVEAIDKDGSIGLQKLKEQCTFYAKLFSIEKEDYLAESYSDLLLAKKSSTN